MSRVVEYQLVVVRVKEGRVGNLEGTKGRRTVWIPPLVKGLISTLLDYERVRVFRRVTSGDGW